MKGEVKGGGERRQDSPEIPGTRAKLDRVDVEEPTLLLECLPPSTDFPCCVWRVVEKWA